jgi:hypothetical protein
VTKHTLARRVEPIVLRSDAIATEDVGRGLAYIVEVLERDGKEASTDQRK